MVEKMLTLGFTVFESQLFGSLTTTVVPYQYFVSAGGLFEPRGNTAKSSRNQLSEVASRVRQLPSTQKYCLIVRLVGSLPRSCLLVAEGLAASSTSLGVEFWDITAEFD